jgi:hypothetical protein
MSAFDDFFKGFETVPKILSDLALSMAVAQQRMDVDYINNLKAIMQIAAPLLQEGKKLDEFLTLFKAIGPARYQFNQTTFEVRVDMQSSTGDQFSIGVTVPFAVAVNASYARRTVSDFRASALIRTVLTATVSDPATMQTLLNAAKDAPGVELPKEASPNQKAIQEALNGLAAIGTKKDDKTPALGGGASSGGAAGGGTTGGTSGGGGATGTPGSDH